MNKLLSDIMNDVTVYVCTHKKFDIKKDDLYTPLLCGAKYHNEYFGYLRDDMGDNISDLNPYFSELSGLFWIWKNSDSNIVGLCHYRRYFIKHIYGGILNKEDIKNYLNHYDIIVAKKWGFTYSMYEQYSKSQYEKDLILVKESIENLFPEYIPCFEEFFKGNKFYPFCMFVSKKKLINDYCSWLFTIFEDFRKKIDLDSYETDYNKIVFAFLGERLFNVWIMHKKLNVKECYVKRLEVNSNFVTLIDENFMNNRLSDFLINKNSK